MSLSQSTMLTAHAQFEHPDIVSVSPNLCGTLSGGYPDEAENAETAPSI